MSNENKTIHDFELNLLCDLGANMERQGPGSPEATLKPEFFSFGTNDLTQMTLGFSRDDIGKC